MSEPAISSPPISSAVVSFNRHVLTVFPRASSVSRRVGVNESLALQVVATQERGGLELQHLSEVPTREPSLADRNRNRGCSSDSSEPTDVLRRDWFLQEPDVVWLDRLCELNRHRWAETSVNVNGPDDGPAFVIVNENTAALPAVIAAGCAAADNATSSSCTSDTATSMR